MPIGLTSMARKGDRLARSSRERPVVDHPTMENGSVSLSIVESLSDLAHSPAAAKTMLKGF